MPVILPEDDFFLGCLVLCPTYRLECYEFCGPPKGPEKTFFHLSLNLENVKWKNIGYEKQSKQFSKSKGRVLKTEMREKHVFGLC